MRPLLALLACLVEAGCASYLAMPPIDWSLDACLPCTSKLDRESMLTMISEEQMCDRSQLYGLEVTEPFLSRTFTKRGVFDSSPNPKVRKLWAKTWQLRTVAVQRKNGTVHHIVLPFIVDPGGFSPLLGPAAASVLRGFGAAELHGAETALCSLAVALPIKSESCVVEYDRAGHSPDMRDNMIGEENAMAINLMDSLVTKVRNGRSTRAEALEDFMEAFSESGAVFADVEREFDLTIQAPVVASFPPTAEVTALLKHAIPRLSAREDL